MEHRYEPLRAPFSTADAESPRLTAERGSLRVTYRDWREKTVELRFHEVVAFSWDDGEAAVDPAHRDDTSYVVHNTPWLARHREVWTLMPSPEHRHFKLCFNASGVLQVLAARLEVMTEPVL
ncbi:MAG: hypothetical protein U0800_17260 [Isosphaeraceae bacterium]